MIPADVARAIEAVHALEAVRLLASLVSIVRDVDLAEQLVQDAFVGALEQWPTTGIPDQPGAWLLAAARHRAVDALRRAGRLQRAEQDLLRTAVTAPGAPDPATLAENEVGDDLLRLVFACCHPALPRDARTALVLRLLGGLTTAAIARAYLVPEATIAQRLVRAKRQLQAEPIAFELPSAAERQQRLASVLEVVYLIFNEGYAATASGEWLCRDLCSEALRLSRVLAALLPDESEVYGLAALLELQASRLDARTDSHGDPILLHHQDRTRWDRLAILRGDAALQRALQIQVAPGQYTLQAAIAASHARAADAATTDWPRIVGLYGQLLAIAPSPVVALNRAVAVAMAYGADAGLVLVDDLRGDPALRDYHLLPSVRGDLLVRLGRREEARAEFERAAAATRNERERALLRRRAADCTPPAN